MTPSIADQAQRDAALNISKSFIIQAPAGSGKTELLTQRYLALLSQAVSQPEEIIAITFTRKAAAEMRARIINALLACANPIPEAEHAQKTYRLAEQVLKKDQQLQWQLLENPQRLRVFTIDSLCFSLAKQMPLLAEGRITPEVCVDANQYYQQTARQIIQSIHNDVPWLGALQQLALHLDNQLDKLENLLIQMQAKRDQWLPYLYLHDDATQLRSALELGLQHITDDLLAELHSQFPKDILAQLGLLTNFARQHMLLRNPEHPLCLYNDYRVVPETQQQQIDYWNGLSSLLLTNAGFCRKSFDARIGFPAASSQEDKESRQLYKEMKQRITELNKHLAEDDKLQVLLEQWQNAPPLTYAEQQWQILLALLEILPVLNAQLLINLQQQSQVDFIAISQAASQALGKISDPSDLALLLDYQIRHILVDEFQDTAINQLHLLEKLTAGWEANDGRSLFIVGDPMQSIYRFRKAEVGLFLRVQQQGIGHIHLDSLTLRTNFRSTANIITWVNTVFAASFPDFADISTGAIPYSKAIAAKNSSDDSVIATHCHLETDYVNEAAKVVKLIQQEQQADNQQSIAILVKSRSHLLHIIPALKAADISFQAVELESLASNPAIRDLQSLTRALLHLGDRIAWFAILRAPWCGLTLADLHQLMTTNPATLLWDVLQNSAITCKLSDDGQQRLRFILPILQHALQQRQRQNLTDWIKSTWCQLLGPQCLSSDQLADVDSFWQLLDSLDASGQLLDHSLLETKLAELYSRNINNTSKLHVMTIHKSKGLEFDVVILPGLAKTPQVDQARLLAWYERPTEHGEDLILAPIKGSGHADEAIYDYLRRIESIKQHYETGRLLYVAVTRAKQRLHLLAKLELQKLKTADDVPTLQAPSKSSMLGHIWNCVALQFNQQISQEATAIDSVEKHQPKQLQRLSLQSLPQDSTPATITSPFNKIHLTWQQDTQRLFGIFLHRLLQQIATDGLTSWTSEKITRNEYFFRCGLAQQGISNNELNVCVDRLITSLHNIINDKQFQWLLSTEHQNAANEFAITTFQDQNKTQHIIDRTFIDQDNRRWIIDYKTSEPQAMDLEQFLQAQQQLYRPQLERYALAMQQYDESSQQNHPIKLLLYFPLLTAWQEWDF